MISKLLMNFIHDIFDLRFYFVGANRLKQIGIKHLQIRPFFRESVSLNTSGFKTRGKTLSEVLLPVRYCSENVL
jgi:hypothetical protein